MQTKRKIKMTLKSVPVVEGAGVRLKRAFGSANVPDFDPFLMLDDFRSNNPADYLKGFPWHPHRGIETISYVLRGEVEHGDSMGNSGVIGAGDVQWMTAGGGIIHQEMPKGDDEKFMCGFQLWANLPASNKMMAPRYREVNAAEIPEVDAGGGVTVKIIAGELCGTRGPVKDIVIEPAFMDITVPPGTEYVHETAKGHTLIVYVIEGAGAFEEGSAFVASEHVILFDDGDEMKVCAGADGVRFLLFSGKPLGEPVAWGGPIVMNTQEELELAFKEYQNGTFIKK